MLCVPSEPVRITGVYEALHFGHRRPHEVFLSQHEIFPRCRQWGSNIIVGRILTALSPRQSFPFRTQHFKWRLILWFSGD